MEFFETMALDKEDLKPSIWYRYVDDTFIVWPHGKNTISNFLQHVNSVRPSIQFTIETKHNGSLAFLDVLVSRKTGIVHVSNTHGAHALSHHESLQSELDHLQKAFLSNGYPKQFITWCLHKKKVQPPATSDRSIQEEKDKKLLVLPYVKGLSEKFEMATPNRPATSDSSIQEEKD